MSRTSAPLKESCCIGASKCLTASLIKSGPVPGNGPGWVECSGVLESSFVCSKFVTVSSSDVECRSEQI